MNHFGLKETVGDRAPLESPALTGEPTAPTAAPGTSTKQLATTEFVSGALTDTAFYKSDPSRVAFRKTGLRTCELAQDIRVVIAGKSRSFPAGTAIHTSQVSIAPAGGDWVIWCGLDWDTPLSAGAFLLNQVPVNETERWMRIGGFHLAPGGNAPLQGSSGGDDTPQINEHSFYDVKFHPASRYMHGMTLVDHGAFWADIYLLNRRHLDYGTSRYGQELATAGNPPKIAVDFGGNEDASSYYDQMSWWAANEIAHAWGKRLPSYGESCAYAYGVVENTNAGGTIADRAGQNASNGTSTVNWPAFTSCWGVIQATGTLWVYGSDLGAIDSGAVATSWDSTSGRGQSRGFAYISLLGGCHAVDQTNAAGSRALSLVSVAPGAALTRGARFVCDHVIEY
jgi:hypothetical protein